MKLIKLEKDKEGYIIQAAVKTLKKGGLIIYPTDTCYGAGVDATLPDAVDKLYQFKGQRKLKPISVAVANQKMAQKYVSLNQTAKFFYNHFLPGPYTIISLSKDQLDPRLAASDHSLGIRIPKNDFTINLIRQYGKPLTSTSANSSYGKTPYSIPDITSHLSSKKLSLIDLIIDAGDLNRNNPPSTIINTLHETTKIIRGDRSPFKLDLIKNFKSNSPQTTIEIGQQILNLVNDDLGYHKHKSTVIFLSGILGAGKTHLAKGIGKQVGVNKVIKSTSFNLFNEYKTNQILWPIFVHADLWRLNHLDNLVKQTLNKYLSQASLIVIEWADLSVNFINQLTNTSLYLVELEYLDEFSRSITLFKAT